MKIKYYKSLANSSTSAKAFTSQRQTEARAYFSEHDSCTCEEDQPRTTRRSTRQLSTETALTQTSIIRIIYRDACLKYFFCLAKRLFSIIRLLSQIDILAGSVGSTQLRCREIFSDRVIANFS